MSLDQPVLVVGGGSVARALVGALSQSPEIDVEIRVWARNGDQARAIAGACSAHSFSDLGKAASGVTAIVICVSDGAIEEVAAFLSEQLDATPGTTVLHVSGYLGSDVLAHLALAGFETGAMHPITAVAKGAETESFQGVYFGVSGSDLATLTAQSLVEALGGHAVAVKDESRGLYHGAAALLSGGVVALFAEAERCLSTALEGGPGDPKNLAVARAVMRGLLESTTRNLCSKSPMDALTGPLARGDELVVAGHGQAFERERLGRAGKLHALLLETMAELVELRDQSEA